MIGNIWKGALCAGLVAIAGAALAQESTSSLDTHIDFNVKDADMVQALEVLTKSTGLKFVLRPGKEEFGKVNLRLDDMPAYEVLQYVCQSAGARAVRDENGVYVVYGPGAEVESKPAPAAVPAGRTILRPIQIMHARPEHILSMLATGTPNYDEPMPGTPLYSPVATNGSFESTRTPVTSGANFQRFGGLGGGVGTGVGQPGGGQGLGNGAVGAGGGGSFSSLRGGQGLVPEGTQRLMYDPATNSLLFQGTARALNDLYALLAAFDKAPQQIQVKFEFVTVTSELHTALGIDWTYERGGVFFGVNPGTFARTQDNVFFNWASGNVSSRLRATLTGSEGNSVFSPMVRTLNNQQGSVQFQTTITIFQSQVSQGAGGNVTSVIATPRVIPTQVSVRPRVNGDGTITMGVNPTISTLGALRRGPDGSEVPDTISQSAQVVATIKNGESIAIGGLTNKTQSSSYARIPLLSDLPVIGQLFRSRHRDDNSSELIIFITPTLVAADEAGLVPGGG